MALRLAIIFAVILLIVYGILHVASYTSFFNKERLRKIAKNIAIWGLSVIASILVFSMFVEIDLIV